jgi:hypothetical protein
VTKKTKTEHAVEGDWGRRSSFAGKKPLVLLLLLAGSNVEVAYGCEVALNNQEHPVVGSAKANCTVIAILINSGFIDAPKSPGKPGFRL